MGTFNNTNGRWKCYQHGMDPVSLTTMDEYKFLAKFLNETYYKHFKNTSGMQVFFQSVPLQMMVKKETTIQYKIFLLLRRMY